MSLPVDSRIDRRHVHVFRRKGRHQMLTMAKVWLEKDGEPCVEIAESKIPENECKMLVETITEHWDIINNQITRSFNEEINASKNKMCKIPDTDVGIRHLDNHPHIYSVTDLMRI